MAAVLSVPAYSVNAASYGWYKRGTKTYYYNKDGYVLNSPDVTSKMLDKASGAESICGFGGYKPSGKIKYELGVEINYIHGLGSDVGFIMFDPCTGMGISYNADESFYSASSIKGIYIASIVNHDSDIFYDDYGTISNVLYYSDNGGYDYLFRKYGSAPLMYWCSRSGVSSSYGTSKYTHYSARVLAKLWASNLLFFHSDDVGQKLADMYENPNTSCIHSELEWRYTTRTKAGWIASAKGTKSTTDGGIVYKGKDGTRPMIIAINSDIPSNHNKLEDFVGALNDAHDELMKIKPPVIKKTRFTSKTAVLLKTPYGLRFRVKGVGYPSKKWVIYKGNKYYIDKNGYVVVKIKKGKRLKYKKGRWFTVKGK